jgi:Ser/Thr protein kinase RdoA (MazF antagonist)
MAISMRAVFDQVLGHWGLWQASLTPISAGLINLTLRVDSPMGAFILQRLHPIFRAELHLDIEAITAHLSEAGLPTPRLVRTLKGDLWVELEEPPEQPGEPSRLGIWRLQTALVGRTLTRVELPALAWEAGALLGRFHLALQSCEHRFRFTRQAHGLDLHRRSLEQAIANCGGHRLAEKVLPLAEELFAMVDRRVSLEELPQRITHGDPKISNVLFHELEDRALAWVDLDTLGRLTLPVELGDALRSWCNPMGEDGHEPALDLSLFEAALTGYAREASGFVTSEEKGLLVEGVAQIATELACRFAADALSESYFGWDASRFPGRGEHNLHRALAQLSLARSVERRRSEAEAALSRAFSAAP